MSNVLLATSEAVPLAKTGGLADVCSALSLQLRRLGHQSALIMPAYREALHKGLPITPMNVTVAIPVGNQVVDGELLRTFLPGSDVPVYLVAQDYYFNRPALYGEDGLDYRDNCERFVFFSRAVLEAIRLLDLKIDLLHCNDWQSGLVPVFLRTDYRGVQYYESIATLLTIHNMAYQGCFWHWDMLLTGLDWKYFNWKQLEYYGDLNLLKAGIVFADSINTVSPRYATEIQCPPLGCGLEGALYHRRDVLEGILNGVDYSIWNPASDEHLAQKYDSQTHAEGRAACKSALQHALGLKEDPRVPLIGFVGRLVEQKGLDLILEVIRRGLSADNTQWVLLGRGQDAYEQQLLQLSREFPQQISTQLDFSDRLAHQIEAAADVFAMPSRFEPCGLNQLYSLKYGAVPVVHATGGLLDTIQDASDAALEAGVANGFTFSGFNPTLFEVALRRACDMYRDRPDLWQRIVSCGMNQDWSWRRSAEAYLQLYQRTIDRVREAVCA